MDHANKPINSTEKCFPKSREQLLNDFDLLDFTESLDEFDEELDPTLDDAEVDALDKEIEEMDELEVHIVFLAMVHNAFKDILYK